MRTAAQRRDDGAGSALAAQRADGQTQRAAERGERATGSRLAGEGKERSEGRKEKRYKMPGPGRSHPPSGYKEKETSRQGCVRWQRHRPTVSSPGGAKPS